MCLILPRSQRVKRTGGWRRYLPDSRLSRRRIQLTARNLSNFIAADFHKVPFAHTRAALYRLFERENVFRRLRYRLERSAAQISTALLSAFTPPCPLGAVQGAPSFRKLTISPGCTLIQGADSDVPENRQSDPDAVSFEKQVRPSCITEACIRSAEWGADRWVSPFLLYHSAFARCATQTRWRKSGKT